jgi:hypothetical protein
MMPLIAMATFLVMFALTYVASTIEAISLRIILVPMGMMGMISSAIIFFLSILNLIL